MTQIVKPKFPAKRSVPHGRDFDRRRLCRQALDELTTEALSDVQVTMVRKAAAIRSDRDTYLSAGDAVCCRRSRREQLQAAATLGKLEPGRWPATAPISTTSGSFVGRRTWSDSSCQPSDAAGYPTICCTSSL
jgi:hypothetical protein